MVCSKTTINEAHPGSYGPASTGRVTTRKLPRPRVLMRARKLTRPPPRSHATSSMTAEWLRTKLGASPMTRANCSMEFKRSWAAEVADNGTESHGRASVPKDTPALKALTRREAR